jgi:murein DD-endopeptidase MepM/ murein hydrolase activator NlpD
MMKTKPASMKQLTATLLFLFLITSCTSTSQPIPTAAVTEVTPTSTTIIAEPTNTPTIVPTNTPVPPSPTPIPCDPFAVDFCIAEGDFLFQPPILPPGNDQVDITYLYGSTDNGKRDPHHGVEFQNAFGTPVYAAGEGEVILAGTDKEIKLSPWNEFYGNVIIIRHANELYTLYAHLSTILVQVGDAVNMGDMIGEVGDTGAATGSHLHFEVREGGDYTDYFSTENPVFWLIPHQGTGTLSITLKMQDEQNIERPLVVSYHVDDSADPSYIYYITSYGKEFDHNAEDAVLGSLPSGRYRISFNDTTGLRERWVDVEAGKLTEVTFEVK